MGYKIIITLLVCSEIIIKNQKNSNLQEHKLKGACFFITPQTCANLKIMLSKMLICPYKKATLVWKRGALTMSMRTVCRIKKFFTNL